MSDDNGAAIAILKDFVTTLLEAGLSREDALKLAFDLAFELVEYPNVTVVTARVTPPEAERSLKAAALLKEAALSFLG